jgi:uncharacterized membrane protein YfhO
MLVICGTHNTVMSNSIALFICEAVVTLLTNFYVLQITLVVGIFRASGE